MNTSKTVENGKANLESGSKSSSIPNHHLLKLVEDEPQFKDLQKGFEKNHNVHQYAAIVIFYKLGLLVDYRELYGNSFVTENLINNAKKTATVMSISSIIDSVFCFPLLYYSFGALGAPSVALGLVATLGITAFSNSTAALAASRSKGNSLVSVFAGLGFLAMASLLTLTSAIGAELFDNKAELAEIVATDQVRKYIKKQDSTSTQSLYESALKESTASCQRITKDLTGLSGGSVGRGDLIRQGYGSFENFKNLSEYSSNIGIQDVGGQPPCIREVVYLKAKEQDESIISEKEEVEKLKQNRAISTNDVEFLRDNVPELYKQFFDPTEGTIKEGTLAVKTATDNLTKKIKANKWSELGFSLFLLLVSAITSATACFLAFCLAISEDAEKSTCPVIRKEIVDTLNALRENLHAEHSLSSNCLPNVEPFTSYKKTDRLLSILTNDILKNGLTDSSPLMRYINMQAVLEDADKVEKLQLYCSWDRRLRYTKTGTESSSLREVMEQIDSIITDVSHE